MYKVLLIVAQVWTALVFSFVTASANDPESTEFGVEKLVCIDGKGAVDAECLFRKNIQATLSNPEKWTPSGKNKGKSPAEVLELTVEGYVLTGIKGRFFEENILRYQLIRAEKDREIWKSVLAGWLPFETRKLTFSVREKGTSKIYGTSVIDIVVAPNWRIFAWAVMLAAILIVFGFLVSWGNLLREGPVTATNQDRRPFSLARTQMAFWFFMILIGYLFIWISTGKLDALEPSMLGLMGISVATGLSAVAVGGAKKQFEMRSVEKLSADIAILEAELEQKQTIYDAAPDDDNKKKLWGEIVGIKDALVEERARLVWLKSDKEMNIGKKFVRDIFTSSGQSAFSRFQMVVWTLVLGFVFWNSIWVNLVMPTFNPTLLGLMGVSGLTYVGFKFPPAPDA